MFNWLFRNKEELPESEPMWKKEPIIEVIPRTYSDKGITFRENNKANPWQCYFSITKKIDGKHKTIQFHIGYFKTKEEAQKARWEFIENLK